MKYCNVCEIDKEDAAFHKRKASSDGLSARCKSCQKVYDKVRSKDSHRVAARAIYAQSQEGRLAGNRAKSEYRKRNPIKSKANAVVSRQIRAGNLVPCPCEICQLANVVAHHDDYAKRLNVRWLCAVHHREWHDQNGEGLHGAATKYILGE